MYTQESRVHTSNRPVHTSNRHTKVPRAGRAVLWRYILLRLQGYFSKGPYSYPYLIFFFDVSFHVVDRSDIPKTVDIQVFWVDLRHLGVLLDLLSRFFLLSLSLYIGFLLFELDGRHVGGPIWCYSVLCCVTACCMCECLCRHVRVPIDLFWRPFSWCVCVCVCVRVCSCAQIARLFWIPRW